MLRVMPDRAPTSIEILISHEFPYLSNQSRVELSEVVHDMFFGKRIIDDESPLTQHDLLLIP